MFLAFICTKGTENKYSPPGSATLAAGDKLATAVQRRGKSERERLENVTEKSLRIGTANVGTMNKKWWRGGGDAKEEED